MIINPFIYSSAPPDIVTDGLILRLDAGNVASYPGSGTVWTDLTTPQYDGTLTNGVGFDSGNEGTLVFDGVDDYVVSSMSKTIMGGTFSISIWFRPTGAQSSKGIMNISNSINSTSPMVLLQRQSSTLTRWAVGNAYVFSTTNLDDAFVNLTLTYDGTTWKQFKNGIASGTHVGTNAPTASNTWLGAGYNGKFNGKIPIYNVWDKALTPAEITQNFDALKGRYGL